MRQRERRTWPSVRTVPVRTVRPLGPPVRYGGAAAMRRALGGPRAAGPARGRGVRGNRNGCAGMSLGAGAEETR